MSASAFAPYDLHLPCPLSFLKQLPFWALPQRLFLTAPCYLPFFLNLQILSDIWQKYFQYSCFFPALPEIPEVFWLSPDKTVFYSPGQINGIAFPVP